MNEVVVNQRMKKVANTSGGEYAGPCPQCGGEDRFRVWPDHPDSDTGRYWCRQCEWSGDGIQYLRDVHGLSFPEACEELGATHKLDKPTKRRPRRRRQRKKTTPKPRKVHRPPGEQWQERAVELAIACYERLYTDEGAKALAYLHGRGLSDAIIYRACLGYHPADTYETPEQWGLKRDDDVWLPRGITIPWQVAEPNDYLLWRLKVRRPKVEKKKRYRQVPGGSRGLYMAQTIQPGRRSCCAKASSTRCLSCREPACLPWRPEAQPGRSSHSGEPAWRWRRVCWWPSMLMRRGTKRRAGGRSTYPTPCAYVRPATT